LGVAVGVPPILGARLNRH